MLPMNLSPKFYIAVVAFAAIMCAAFFFMAGEPEKEAAKAVSEKPVATAKPTASTPTPTTASPVPAPAQNPPSIPAGDPAAQEKILSDIDDATVLYSPEGLPKIQPYLLHADPEVRAAALDGMINLGEAGAAPILRAASQLAPTPEEAAAMREAAAYLELPPGRLPKRVAPSK